MKQLKLLLLSLSLFLTKACYPVSHVIVGETQTPIDYTDGHLYGHQTVHGFEFSNEFSGSTPATSTTLPSGIFHN